MKNIDNSLNNDAIKKNYQSQLKPYSLGVLTANKENGSDLIDVLLIELQWASNGEINNNYTQESVESVDITGETVKYSIISSNNITAAWYPFANSNRVSPPELRRGMIVMIYTDGDNNYYWVDSGMNRELMRSESVTYAFCANPNVDENRKISHDDWYIFEISPRTKQILLATSQADNEYTTYNLIIDTKNGVVSISDGLGNFITMDSRNIQHRLENQKGTYIELLGDNIKLYAPRNIDIEAGNNITVKASNNIDYTCGNDYRCNVSGEYNYKIGGGYTVNAGGNYTVKSLSYTLNPTSGSGIAHGDINIDGKIESNNIITKGNIHAGGNITANGKIDCKN